MSEDQIERLQIDLTQLVGEVVTVDAVQQHTVSSADLTVCRMRYRISDIGYRKATQTSEFNKPLSYFVPTT